MPDEYDNDDQSQDEPSPRDLRQQLAERAREAEELRQQLEQAKRDAEFTKALGPALDEPRIKDYFVPAYKGELNADAIKKAATEAGFLTEPAPPPVRPEPAPAWMSDAAAGAPGAATTGWQEALAQADRIQNEQEREAAILDVVERYGGFTSRTAQ